MLTRRLLSFGCFGGIAAVAAFAPNARAQDAAASGATGSSSSAPAPGPSTQPAPSATATPSPATAPAPSAAAPAAGIHPALDQQDLTAQGSHRPLAGEVAESPQEVFSDDWWGKARPTIDVHGYFRTRGQVFHNFFLGRHSSTVGPYGAIDSSGQYLFPAPLDQSYANASGGWGSGATSQSALICGPGIATNTGPGGAGAPNEACFDKTQSSANVRLRFDPEVVISDNLRIATEIFALDNLVLGSTPNSYATIPSGTTATGYSTAASNRFAPINFFSTTQGPPTAGVNSTTNSISVQRVWAEYMTPLGQLRFGRMPGHWGLGMVENSGDGIDSDYQTTLDRIQFISGLKSMDIYFGGSWDFPSSGPTSSTPYDVYGGQPYNTCNLCNVSQWSAFVAHRTSPELQKLQLSRGDLVLNGGLYTTFRTQELDTAPGTTNDGATPASLESRKAWALTPDLWLQLLWRKLRIEAELATINGEIGSSTLSTNTLEPTGIREYGIATQTEFRAAEDKLDLQFGFGWASGDQYANNAGANALTPAPTGLQGELQSSGNQVADISTFRFHPDYRVDLIFFRNIMQQIEGAYYFRPSVDYDFLRHPDGEKLGAGTAVIWSRASEFIQTPGHKRDLGVEVDAQFYYQSKDGSLNDDPTKIGGFYAMLQYGIFFPLGGLSYLPNTVSVPDASVSAAQTVRLFLGVAY
jgi:uncharacterized protein (TIGR04551 family)